MLILKDKEVVSYFRKLGLIQDNIIPKYSLSALEYEAQRFNLQAANLGLYHYRYSLLDYRLREVEKLITFVGSLLEELGSALVNYVYNIFSYSSKVC